ncbi:MAG: 2,3,4,5-tetrahydropyridine-2,6-dicarboxylate N-succinyltransferase [Calditrichaceae bacterium]
MNLRDRIEKLYAQPAQQDYGHDYFSAFAEFKDALNQGSIRIAEKKNGNWVVNDWVKKGILLGFRIGKLQDTSINDKFVFYDKSTYPLKKIKITDGVRLVPGGSSIRDGCYVSPGVVCMPPMYVNVGAYVGSETMIDSHALVGSCAQIGERVHLSAGTQIGGVLEPIGALPVIIEDDVLVGGNCGIYEGALVRRGAVIAAGVVITGGTPVYDLVHEKVYRKEGDKPLEIPENAVVVPGSRPINKGWGREQGLSLYTPVIVKYKDEKTSKSVELEDLLR